jgi:uncharacterized protein (TIGR02594 family)
MSRRFGTRTWCALFVIVTATIAVQSASFHYFQSNEWVAATLLAKLATLDADLNQHALESKAEIVRLREELATRLSAAADFISGVKHTTRMTALPASVARPDAAAEAPMPAASDELQIAAIENPPAQKSTAQETIVAIAEPAGVTPAPTQAAAPESEMVVAALPVKKPMLAALGETEKPAADPVSPPTAEVKAVREEKPAAEAKPVAEAEPAAIADLKFTPEEKPAPVLEMNVIREEPATAVVEVKIVREEKPTQSVEPAAGPEEKPEEKQIFASLGWQITAVDVEPLPPPAAVEAKVVPQSNPAPAEPEISPIGQASDDPFELGNVPISSPVQIRALTRADIPAADKLASLGPAQSSARNLPAEEQRVAYDAPAVLDQPKSIGRRRWADEAAKYQGLGSPEALLEALRHMGASAKTLGLPGSLWCADFMNLVLRKSGLNATGSRAALSYLKYGTKIDEPRVGAIAIFSRGKNSGHIGIVHGTDGAGNPIIVSGNHNHKVAEAVYPKSRVLAYVVPR